MIRKNFLLPAILVLFSLASCTRTQTGNYLPRSTPEAEGVSSADIINFLDAAAKTKHEFHSIMILRHGKVVAEGWWDPYRADLRHTLYSTSKSFTSTAAGFAVNENKISLGDKVISFFPEYLPDTISENLAALTIKDLLCMSAGQEPDPTFSITSGDGNWLREFLALPIPHKPGTRFLYNTLATYTVAAIIQKVTGETLVDYLRPRLFDPLGIQGMDWETDPMGRNTGGWGLRVKTEDMAKFGQLYLQKGRWNGRQILSEKWVEEATTMKIEQAPEARQSQKDSSDWLQGYGYQFWRCRPNAFRADGAYGQYIIVLPEKDAVIAITSESPNMQDEINLVWEYLLPAIRNQALPADEKTLVSLKAKLANLQLSPPDRGTASPKISSFSGKTFTLECNEKQLKSVSFSINDSVCRLRLQTAIDTFLIDFGWGNWQLGETNKPGPFLIRAAKNNLEKLQPFRIAASYGWKNDNSLELVLRYIESPHSEAMFCTFDKDKLLMEIRNSNAFGSNPWVLKGTLQK
jgi:CubicO group peptidase (beta-lactamase class C family)